MSFHNSLSSSSQSSNQHQNHDQQHIITDSGDQRDRCRDIVIEPIFINGSSTPSTPNASTTPTSSTSTTPILSQDEMVDKLSQQYSGYYWNKDFYAIMRDMVESDTFDREMFQYVATLCDPSLLDSPIYCNDDPFDQTEYTFLFEFAQRFDWEMVRFFISLGADPIFAECPIDDEPSGQCGYSLLHFAISDPNVTIELIDYLIDLGIDIEDPGHNFQTPLLLAAKLGRYDLVRYLIEECGADINATCSGANSPLHYACFGINNLELIQYLINDIKFDINSFNGVPYCNEDHHTTLAIAARYSSLDVVKYLVENNATIYPDEDVDVLLLALQNEDKTNFEYLIQCVDDLTIRSEIINKCLLQSICPDDEFKISKYLLEQHNADRNFQGKVNWYDEYDTAFLYYVISLFDDDKSDHHQTILQFIRYLQPTRDELQILTADGGFTSLWLAIRKYNGSTGCFELIKCLINEFGAGIHNLDDRGSNMLHAFFYSNYHRQDYDYQQRLPLLNYCFELGIDINSVNRHGQTPFHFAAQHPSVSKFQLLFQHKANINAVDNDGNTPLRIALTMDTSDFPSTSIHQQFQVIKASNHPFGAFQKQLPALAAIALMTGSFGLDVLQLDGDLTDHNLFCDEIEDMISKLIDKWLA